MMMAVPSLFCGAFWHIISQGYEAAKQRRFSKSSPLTHHTESHQQQRERVPHHHHHHRLVDTLALTWPRPNACSVPSFCFGVHGTRSYYLTPVCCLCCTVVIITRAAEEAAAFGPDEGRRSK